MKPSRTLSIALLALLPLATAPSHAGVAVGVSGLVLGWPAVSVGVGYHGGHGGHHGGYHGGRGGHGGHHHGGYPYWRGGLYLGAVWPGYGYGYGYPYGYGYGWPSPWVAAPPLVVESAPIVAEGQKPAPVYNNDHAAPDPVIYPRNGQSAEQQEIDHRECNRWATTQRNAVNDGSVFQRAVFACLDGRGYTVR